MWLPIVRVLLRPVERLSARAAAWCWLVVLTLTWLVQARRRHRAWKTLRALNEKRNR